MLTAEQITELKQQLSDQIQHLSPEQKTKAQEQIDGLSPEALEAMLDQQKEKKSVLRMIVDHEIPSRVVEETAQALAVVEIRPVSKAHILIIQKEPSRVVNPKALALARKIAKRIMLKLKPKGVEIQTETKFNEQVIDIIPYYEKPLSIFSPRYEAEDKELDATYNALKLIKRKKTIKPRKKTSSTIILKRRIP